MTNLTSRLFAVLTPALLVGQPVAAETAGTGFTLTPNFLSVEVKDDGQEELQEAKFNSGLGMQLRSSVLQFDVDYKLQSHLQDSSDDAQVSQQLGASLYSQALNEVLGLDADIKAGSTIRHGGDAYVYSITPGISKSLADLGRFSLQYQYLLDKAGAESAEKEKTGLQLGLDGSAQEGRLTWKGNYRTTDVYGGVEQLQSTELLEFESSYQLVPALQLQVSGQSKDETRFDGGIVNELYNETRYGAGFAWSPSQHYSLAFKVNKLDESRARSDEVFGSGTFSWFPNRDMEFTFSYGDHLVEGARGVMFSTKIDLNDS